MPSARHRYKLKSMTLTTDDLAICVLLHHRTWTLKQIANELGVKHNTLISRCPLFMFAYKTNAESMKREVEMEKTEGDDLSMSLLLRYVRLKEQGLKLTNFSKLKAYKG